MKYVQNPNSWSCLLACASMVTEIPFPDLIRIIGHDGKEKINEKHRGFSVEEIMYVFLVVGVKAYAFNKNLMHYYSSKPMGKDCWCKDMVLQQFPHWDRILEFPRKICMTPRHSWVEWDGVISDPSPFPRPQGQPEGVIVIASDNLSSG